MDDKKPKGAVTQEPPVEESDLQERIDSFNKELMPLLGKYELGLAAMPKIMQDGRMAADPVIVSVRQMRREQAKSKKQDDIEPALSNPES